MAEASSPAGIALSSRPEEITREQILEECRKADESESRSQRNLVLLFDGTGNILGNQRDSNVVRLLRALHKDPAGSGAGQVVYYDPGVGTANTFPSSNWHAQLRRQVHLFAGLALGSGVFENIAEAYEFLVRNYQKGDRIYLFGFSRGAFTARAVGGMVNMYGLIAPHGLAMVQLMVANYFAEAPGRSEHAKKLSFASDIQGNFTFGRTPLIHFTGVWDTVDTIGSGLIGGVRITNTPDFHAKRFAHVRHAVSIHESRCKYRPRLYQDPVFSDVEKTHRSFKEHWFAGAHSDIGGSYPRDGLSVLTLQWMIQEAIPYGLIVTSPACDPLDPDLRMHDETFEMPYWVWTGIDARERPAPVKWDRPAAELSDTPAPQTCPRKASWVDILMWLSFALSVLLWLGALATTALACRADSVGILGTLAAITPPGQAAMGPTCNGPQFDYAQRWVWTSLASLALWLPFPMAWSLRRLVRAAINHGVWLTKRQRTVQWQMVAFFALSVLQNWGSNYAQLHVSVPWLVSLVWLGKLWFLSGLVIVWLQGALTSRH